MTAFAIADDQPDPLAPSTRIGRISAALIPATPMPLPVIAPIVPATCVPWPLGSTQPLPPDDVVYASPTKSSPRSQRTRPDRSGWLAFTPLSMTATSSAEPVATESGRRWRFRSYQPHWSGSRGSTAVACTGVSTETLTTPGSARSSAVAPATAERATSTVTTSAPWAPTTTAETTTELLVARAGG